MMHDLQMTAADASVDDTFAAVAAAVDKTVAAAAVAAAVVTVAHTFAAEGFVSVIELTSVEEITSTVGMIAGMAAAATVTVAAAVATVAAAAVGEDAAAVTAVDADDVNQMTTAHVVKVAGEVASSEELVLNLDQESVELSSGKEYSTV